MTPVEVYESTSLGSHLKVLRHFAADMHRCSTAGATAISGEGT